MAASVAVLAGWCGVARAAPVEVQVIDVGGGVTYVSPGEDVGLRIGTRVAFGDVTLVVVEVNAKTAALRPETGQTAAAAIGARGTAEVTPRVPPRPPEAFREQWPPPVVPVKLERDLSSQVEGSRMRTRVTVIGSGFAAIGERGRSVSPRGRASGEARVIATFDELGGRPLGIDLDVAGRGYSIGFNREENDPIFVRAAQLRYGRTLAVGRLRHAATMIGMLDGGRVAVNVGALELAAFGGIVPDALSGEPDPDTARFGTEVAWDDPRASWQPRVALGVYGSTFEGELDERRAVIVASAGHERVWLDGWAEAQQFASDNPFGANTVELVGAGAGITWRSREAHAGIGATFLRPERSLRLEAVLPGDWQCARNAAGGCVGGDYWIATTGSAGLRRGGWSLDAVVSVGQTRGVSIGGQGDPLAIGIARDGAGYLRGELRTGRLRFFAAPAGGRTAFADWVAVELGTGIALARVDASIAYRPELLDERSGDRVTLHSAVAELRASVSPAVDVMLAALGTFGEDRSMLAVLATLVWRAR